MISTAKTKDKAIVPVLYRRDRVTWLSFLLLGTYSYLQAAPGPLMPFVQETFHFNQTIASLHLSLFAFGMILAGVVGKQAILRWSRWQLLWGGGTGMAVGALLFASGWHPVVTLFSTFVMGFFGSLLFVALQAILVDRHAAHQATAISEANVVASLGATLSSTCLAALVIVGLGWRAMLCVPVLVFFVLALLFRTDAEIDTGQRQQRVQKTARARLPLAFWFSWTILLFGVAIEWSMAFWGAAFLVNVIGVSGTMASGLMGLFFGGEIVSRIVLSRWTHTYAATFLLLLAFLCTLLGFLFFWLGPFTIVHIVGLGIAGLGVGSLFPLSLSIAISQAPEDVDGASACCVSGAGLALLLSPLILGRVSDLIGLQKAYTGIFVLLLLLGAMIIYEHKWVRRPAIA